MTRTINIVSNEKQGEIVLVVYDSRVHIGCYDDEDEGRGRLEKVEEA